jgi:hypothetical protein
LDFVRQRSRSINRRREDDLPNYRSLPFGFRFPFFNAGSLPLLGLLTFEGLKPPSCHLAQERARRVEEWTFVHSKFHEKPLSSRMFGDVFIAHPALILLTLSTGLAPGLATAALRWLFADACSKAVSVDASPSLAPSLQCGHHP